MWSLKWGGPVPSPLTGWQGHLVLQAGAGRDSFCSPARHTSLRANTVWWWWQEWVLLSQRTQGSNLGLVPP